MSTSTLDLIKQILVERLQLADDPKDIADDAPLFAPMSEGGLELDSLAVLEIMVALSMDLDLNLEEVPQEALETVRTLADFVDDQLSAQRAAS